MKDFKAYSGTCLMMKAMIRQIRKNLKTILGIVHLFLMINGEQMKMYYGNGESHWHRLTKLITGEQCPPYKIQY